MKQKIQYAVYGTAIALVVIGSVAFGIGQTVWGFHHLGWMFGREFF